MSYMKNSSAATMYTCSHGTPNLSCMIYLFDIKEKGIPDSLRRKKNTMCTLASFLKLIFSNSDRTTYILDDHVK